MEISTLVAGILIGMLGYKIRTYFEDEKTKPEQYWTNKIYKLETKIIELNDPKRLLEEYQGDEGSSTGELVKSMQEKISILEQQKEELENEVEPLKKEKNSLSSKVNELKKDLNSELQNAYDTAIDNINNLLTAARKGGAVNIKKGLDILNQKKAELTNSE